MAQRSLELLIDARVRKLFDHFGALLGIRIALYSPDGEELAVGLDRPGCRYCTLLRTRLDRDRVCRAEDAERRAQAAAAGELVAYRCHAGLEEAVLPVAYEGHLLGFVMIGQYRTAAAAPSSLLREWRAKWKNAALERAFRAVPRHEPALRQHVLGLVGMIVELIVAERLVSRRVMRTADRVLSLLRDEPATRLSEAARIAGMSPSGLSRRLRRELGTGYKRQQTELRLAEADALLAEGRLTVGQIAKRLGYDDPLYFSRVYRRHRGRPPSAAYRAAAK
jgi:AraC-like DNA-binding protein